MTDGRTVASTAPAGFTANPTFAPELARQGIRVEVRTAAEPAAYSFTALFLGLAFVGVPRPRSSVSRGATGASSRRA